MTGAVLLVEDHRLIAQAVAIALRERGTPCTVLDLDGVTTAHEVLTAVTAARPGVVWLDLDLGRLGDAAPLVPDLVGPGLRVLVVTGDDDEVRWGRALLAGAAGVVHKSSPLPDLLAALERARAGEEVTRHEERRRLEALARRSALEQDAVLAPLRSLTPREAEVLRQLADGLQAAEIARRAVVAESTVRAQIRAVLHKLGVSSQLQAVAYARRHGWLGDD